MISVVMPVYNAEKYIKSTIESILSQSEQDFELVIVDDCGFDKSMDIVRSMDDSRIRIVKNCENKGIAYSRNRGIEEAKGEYIALMDDDDIAPVYRFAMEKEFLDKHSDIDVVAGKMKIIDENDKDVFVQREIIFNPPRMKAEMLFHDCVANGSAMLRRDFIRKNRLVYQDGFLGMEDYKFWTEAVLYGKIKNLDALLLYWRKSENAVTNKSRSNQAEQRKLKYDEIRKDAFIRQGFELTENEFKKLFDVFTEQRTFVKFEDMREVQIILKKLIKQAYDSEMENVKEFEITCRHLWGLRTKDCDLWS